MGLRHHSCAVQSMSVCKRRLAKESWERERGRRTWSHTVSNLRFARTFFSGALTLLCECIGELLECSTGGGSSPVGRQSSPICCISRFHFSIVDLSHAPSSPFCSAKQPKLGPSLIRPHPLPKYRKLCTLMHMRGESVVKGKSEPGREAACGWRMAKV